MRTVPSRLSWRKARTVFLGSLSLALLGSAAVGCGLISSNIFDVTIGLSSQTYGHDFGTATGTAPSISCPVTPDPCGAIAAQVPGGSNGHCDQTKTPAVCAADVSVVLPSTINLSMDSSFASSVGSKAVRFVHTIDLAYGVNMNTLTFDLPAMQLYLGPSGAKQPTDTGVVALGTIQPISRMTLLPDASQHISIVEGTPAHDKFAYYVQNPMVPFVLMVATTKTVRGGDALPAGKIQMVIKPSITVGLPQ
jgi:hypothetical protein